MQCGRELAELRVLYFAEVCSRNYIGMPIHLYRSARIKSQAVQLLVMPLITAEPARPAS
jgi:hypothetical protein